MTPDEPTPRRNMPLASARAALEVDAAFRPLARELGGVLAVPVAVGRRGLARHERSAALPALDAPRIRAGASRVVKPGCLQRCGERSKLPDKDRVVRHLGRARPRPLAAVAGSVQIATTRRAAVVAGEGLQPGDDEVRRPAPRRPFSSALYRPGKYRASRMR